jgi:sulfur relay (sulfurtransferase) DsrC/TusE family protein
MNITQLLSKKTFPNKSLKHFEIIGILRDYWNTSRLLEYFEIIGILRDYWNTSRLLVYFIYIASKNSCEGYINDYLEFFYIALH